MGRTKDKPHEYQGFESLSHLEQDRQGKWKHVYTSGDKKVTETTTLLCYSQITSDAFNDLTPRQRMLYIYAKSLFYGARSRPGKDFKAFGLYGEQEGRMCFYLNHKLMADVFHLYPKTNHRDLYKDVQALEDHGFIERLTNIKQDDGKGGSVSKGNINHMRTIYTYSDKWQKWPDIDKEDES